MVLHEAEHLRRRDDWINLVQKLCLVVFPLNPALAWMERRLCREREMACDEGVVRRTQAPRAYAACLASLAERSWSANADCSGARRRLSLGAWQRRPELVRPRARHSAARPGAASCGGAGAAGRGGLRAGFRSVELARCPQVVAFAARPAVARVRTLARAIADAMVDGRPMRGFRAMNAVAHVPSRAELAKARRRNGGSR